MRNIKFGVWIFVLFLVQTVLVNYIKVYGARPDFVLPFIVGVALMEDEFKPTMIVNIICAVLAGSLCGRNFQLSVLFVTYYTVLMLHMRKSMRYVPELLKYLIFVAVGAVIMETVSYIMLYSTVSGIINVFIKSVIPVVIYDIIGSLAVYFVLKKTMYRKGSGKKQLIVE